MSTDITWQQLQLQSGIAGMVTIEDGVAKINVNLLTGQTYSDLNSHGVVEFVYKLVDNCNKAQALANQSLPPAERLASFPDPFVSIPQTDADGKSTTISTHQVVARVAQDTNEVSGYQV